MPSGLHTVLVYPDRSAGEWSAPLGSNPYFTDGVAGWVPQPFDPALVATGDGRVTGWSVFRDAVTPIARPPAAVTYRLRALITATTAGNVFYGIFFGKTPHGAQVGPFWDPANATEVWAALKVPGPGTYQITRTWVAPANLSAYPYLGPEIRADNGTSGAMMTVDYLVCDYLTSGGVDMSCLVDEVTINHGRDDSTSQPEPASATLALTITPTDPLPAIVEVGAVVIVNTQTANAGAQRFTGRITDLSLGWEDAGEDTPDAGVGQLVATSVMADLGRRVVGDAPWPQELDGARASRIMTAAGLVPDPAWNDPGTVQVLPRDVDSQAALDLLRGVADDAGAILWHTRDGDVRYADAEHRRGIQPTLELDACDVLVTPTWRRTTEGLINQVSIGYGPEPVDGGEQPRVAAIDVTSIGRYGRYNYTATTQLAAIADAQAAANLLMVRNVSPVWIMAALPVDVESLSSDQYAALLALDVHGLVTLTGIPAIGGAPTTAALWIEGWHETLAYGVHEIELVVSGYCRTAPPPRWDDLDPGWTWNTITPPTITWNDVTCLGPQVNRGRWADVPASLRWNALPPAITWDAWPSTFTAEAEQEMELSYAS